MTRSARVGALARVLAHSRHLGFRDGAVCLLAWCLLHAAALRHRVGLLGSLRLPSPDRWPRAPERPGGPPTADPVAQRLAELLGDAARYPALGLWCLPRAQALRSLLRLHGLDAELAVGLRRGAEGLSGHAWVVYHGAVLDQDTAFAGSFARCEVS